MLSFRYKKVAEFTMYAGSRSGAVLQDISDLHPSDFWGNEIIETESLYKEVMFAFFDDNWIKVLPHNYSFRYRQRYNLIEIFLEDEKTWIPFAYGNKEKLVLKLGLTTFGNVNLTNMGQKRILNCDETCWSAFNYAGIPSLGLLKDKRVKIAWCNMHYTFY